MIEKYLIAKEKNGFLYSTTLKFIKLESAQYVCNALNRVEERRNVKWKVI